jgi:UDP-glucose:(heptosyl)LPS alpha-1,3-glucosyltransferase
MRLALNFQRVDPSKGGAETYVVDLCHRLVRLGHEVDLYAESWGQGVLPAEVRCIPVEARGRTKLTRLLAFARNSEAALMAAHHDCTVGFINTWYHDVIIPQGGVQAGSLFANARRHPAGLRRTAYLLGKQLNPKFRVHQSIERKQYGHDRPMRVVAVSHLVKSHLQRFHQVPTHRVHVIPNAIDADRLAVAHPGATRCRFRNAFDLGPDDLVGLFVGHNFWLKGLAPLLYTLTDRKRRNPSSRPIKLLVCGGGPLPPFEKLVSKLGISENVRLLGFYSDIRDCFHASDFFVSPTYYDPCSLVVFEALACGLPVITTSCNGAGEVMTDGREGFVVTSPEASEELITALDRMTADEDRLKMASHARNLGREQSFDRHVSRLVEVFEEAAAAKRRAGTTPHHPKASHQGRRILK